MKKLASLMILGAIVASISSCSVSAPLLVTDNGGSKTGEASYKVVLGIFRPMDADISIAKAAKNGGITKVSTVDSKVKAGLFATTYITTVTGE